MTGAERDDELEELADDYTHMVDLLTARGFSAAAPVVAAQLLQVLKLDDIETAIASLSDNVMFHLETANSTKGPAFVKWTTEELLKHYNPEVLDIIRKGDAELEVYDDRIVITRPKKPA
jgi:hypothetical protein